MGEGGEKAREEKAEGIGWGGICSIQNEIKYKWKRGEHYNFSNLYRPSLQKEKEEEEHDEIQALIILKNPSYLKGFCEI